MTATLQQRQPYLFRIWQLMHRRCYDATAEGVENYGSRGIQVCQRWFKFHLFVRDMGCRPDGLDLDRIDNDGHYSPENCRWATHKQNCNNKRNNVRLTHNGVTFTVAEWAEQANATVSTPVFRARLKRGWSLERALATPVRPMRLQNGPDKPKHNTPRICDTALT